MRHVGHFGLICLVAVLSPVARAHLRAEIAEAGTPLSEGVPAGRRRAVAVAAK